MIPPLPIPINYIVSHWCNDPYTLGGWSVLTPNATINTRQILQEPIIVHGPVVVEETNELSSSSSSSSSNINNVCRSNRKSNRIYLCGEYTNPTQAGMVHGAYIEGVRVANEIWEYFTLITTTNDVKDCNNNIVDEIHVYKQEQKQKQQKNKEYNVLIIGAGASGLGCAYHLEQLNKSHNNNNNNDNQHTVYTKQSNFHISLTIVEARDRIGGRVRTEEIDIIIQSTQQKQQQQQVDEQTELEQTSLSLSLAASQTAKTIRKTVAVELGANWLQQGYDNNNPLYTIACTSTSSTSNNEKLQIQVVPTNFLKPTVYPKHLQLISTTKSQCIMTQLINRCKQYNATSKSNNNNNNSTTSKNHFESNHQSGQQQQKSNQVLSPSLQDVIDVWFHEIDNYTTNNNNNNNNNNANRTIDTTCNNMYTKQEIQHILEGEIIIDTGVPLCNLSSTLGIEPGVGNGDYWIINGYKQIFDYFVQTILSNSSTNKILYNTPVTTIDSLSLLHNNDDTDSPKIVVTSTAAVNSNNATTDTGKRTDTLRQEQQTFVTDIVVCCIPSAVLQRKSNTPTFDNNGNSNNNGEHREDHQQQQNGSITFIPPIPKRHQDSLDTIITGNVEKIVLCFTTRWWPSSYSDNGGYIRVHGGDYLTNTVSDDDSNRSNNNNNNNTRQQQFGNVCEWLDCTDVYGYPVITGIFTGPWLTSIWSPGSSDYDVAVKATTILYNAIFFNNDNNSKNNDNNSN